MPWTPWARNVLRSAWIPAPPPESDPAMVSTRAGTGTGNPPPYKLRGSGELKPSPPVDRGTAQATRLPAVDCRDGPPPPDPHERGRGDRVPRSAAHPGLRHHRARRPAAPGRPLVPAGGRPPRLLDLRRLPEGPQPGARPRAGPRPRTGARHRRRPGRPLRRPPRPRAARRPRSPGGQADRDPLPPDPGLQLGSPQARLTEGAAGER